MPYIISLCHQKGGVAKTTTTLSLGNCFAEQQFETLMIDLDPQANLTSALGMDPDDIRHSAADVLLGNSTLLQVSRETGLPGLDIVPANADMLTASRFLYLRPNYEYLLRDHLIQEALEFYDVVLIDCPPALGPLTLNALTAANMAIIPTQCEFFSMQALNNIFKLINVVWSKTNPKLSFRILVTMFDRRGTLHGRVLKQLQQNFSHSMLETIIGVDSKLRESQLAGTMIGKYAHSSRGFQQYCALAKELEQYVRQQQTIQTI